MDIISIIILGLVQGVTEFLPISSSGHLVIASSLLGNTSSFEFDVLVNFGTLLAVIIFYRKRIWQIITDVVVRRDFRLLLKLIIATVPAAAVGFLFQDAIETHLHSTVVVTVMLATIGVLMVMSRWWKEKPDLPVNKDLHKVRPLHALYIGLAQCFSLVSGSSRSGVTMLTAIKLGFTKEKAAEWSFLMGIPIILGASLKVLVSEKGQKFISQQTGAFILANVVSFLSGLVAIHLLLRILKSKGLYWFGWYRIVLAVVLIVLLSVKIIA